MAPGKFYAVRCGYIPGIYDTWAACQQQVRGYKGSQFKSFKSRLEAEQYLSSPGSSGQAATISNVSVLESPQSSVRKRPRSRSPPETQPLSRNQEEVYQIEYDGASKRNPGPAGAGALVRAPNGSVVCELREGLGVTTNNVAEYRALILGLCGALERGIYRVRVQGDSNLVCQQIQGNWKVNDPALKVLCKEAQSLMRNFVEFSIAHVDREFNSDADRLANEAVALAETKFASSFAS